jgi:uncharacterized protein (TIGR02117 family)
VLAFAMLACTTKPYIVPSQQAFVGHGAHTIYVVNHGWHTGFVIPAHAINPRLTALKQRFNDAAYIEFGWGDKGFYQAQEITTRLTLQALFWPSESVIHAVAVPSDVTYYFANSQVEALYVTDAELSQLVTFVAASFAVDKQSNIIKSKKGLYGDSQFYQAVGAYHVINTCNKWTAKGLKSMGMDIAPVFRLTSGSVMNYLQPYVRQE